MFSLEWLPRLVILVFSVIAHEVAHGWVALWRGDPTAHRMGRLTLNPIPHIDPFGTLFLPLFLLWVRSPVVIGSARPVPVDPRYFAHPRRDMALVAGAGPLTNLGLAMGAALFFRVVHGVFPEGFLTELMAYGVLLNLVLAFFNLIPIPPLDGSRIALMFLSGRVARAYLRLERVGFFLVLGLLYLGLFRWLVWPFVFFFLLLFIGPEGVVLLAR